MFVVIEGPNGVGKSTIAAALIAHLRAVPGAPAIHATSEPTHSLLGALIRASESQLRPRALALACAADRAYHLDTEILPRLERGEWIVSDRYVQSSLVLQRIDGLDLAEVWRYNDHVPAPTLSAYLDEDPTLLSARLAARAWRSRLETQGSPQQEIDLYGDAHDFLAARGWAQLRINCRGRSPAALAADIADHLPLGP